MYTFVWNISYFTLVSPSNFNIFFYLEGWRSTLSPNVTVYLYVETNKSNGRIRHAVLRESFKQGFFVFIAESF